jgi:ribosomal protein S18 acetylase RimI-like enzyme
MVADLESGIRIQIVTVKADNATEMRHIHHLFKAYAASLDFDLDFQDFQKEINQLPGDYAAPEGCLLLALCDSRAAGCVALKIWSRDVCEMKRLYVRPKYRGQGLGRLLVDKLIAKARASGYRRMRLDTVPSMHRARALYRSLGFEPIGAYRYNPIEGAEFMELDLA